MTESESPCRSQTAISLGGTEQRPWPRALTTRIRKSIQKWMEMQLERGPPGSAVERFRHKLARWRLSGLERRNAEVVLKRFMALRCDIAPRVHVAVLSSLYNRWTTRRRFQRNYSDGCLLGCGGDDAVEHYLRCQHVRKRLRISTSVVTLEISGIWLCWRDVHPGLTTMLASGLEWPYCIIPYILR